MNKYLSFIFASVLTLTGVQLSKASNPSDSLAIVSAKWERTSSLQGIQLKQASIEGLFGGKQSISILTIGRAEGYTAFIATTDSLTTTSQWLNKAVLLQPKRVVLQYQGRLLYLLPP